LYLNKILMIAPDFRATEQLEILKPAKNFVAYNYGKPHV
jgi:hypothetical protein